MGDYRAVARPEAYPRQQAHALVAFGPKARGIPKGISGDIVNGRRRIEDPVKHQAPFEDLPSRRGESRQEFPREFKLLQHPAARVGQVYNHIRPHWALDYLIPAQALETFKKAAPVSHMS